MNALWDTYAAAALGGLAANPNTGCNAPRDFAHWAAQAADAMLSERDKRLAQERPVRGPNPMPMPQAGRTDGK